MFFINSLATLALVGAAIASPVAQGLDLDLIEDLPVPSTYSIAVGVAAETVSVDQAEVVASIVAALDDNPIDSTPGAAKHKRKRRTTFVAVITTTTTTTSASTTSSTTSASTTSSTTSSVGASASCSGGKAQALGAGPVPSPDTASAFVNYAPFAAAATNAAAPTGWTQVYQNQQASNNAYYYLGFTTLKTYDPNTCASKCSAIQGCQAINLYFERDPSVVPGTGSNCDDPPSTTNIKCVFWGAPLTTGTLVNTGETRTKFRVVIAGSNGYNLKQTEIPAGYTTPQSLGNAAINAPKDCNGAETYMGVKIFQNTAFNISLCAQACSATSDYDIDQGIPSKESPQTCQFFNTYMLYRNDKPLAQYCALYNETWNATWATNVGQYDKAGNHVTIQNSYISSNSTNPGTCVLNNIPGPRPACGSTILGQGGCKCTYSVTCNQKYQGGRIIQTLQNISELDCVNACDGYDNCFNVDYSRTTTVCNIYARADSSVAVADDDAFAFAGTCNTSGSSPTCVFG